MRLVPAGHVPHSFLQRRGAEILEHPQAGIGMGFLLPVSEEQVWVAELDHRVTTGIERLQINTATSSPLGVFFGSVMTKKQIIESPNGVCQT
jgi:hypothetical protein